ncbi:nucleotidyltransferase domain-containing protein [bacterium]|nr:nucleotidyltransferase domain-containing protein [bacterium]
MKITDKVFDFFPKENILNVYLYGSRVYGTLSPLSDYDFKVIVSGDNKPEDIKTSDIDIVFLTLGEFQKMVDVYDLVALECLFLPNEMKEETIKFHLGDIDKDMLRISVSSKASNSFSKAKKKIFKENEVYIGKKSLYHVFRMIDFGIQIANYNRIVDYNSMNKIYYDIMETDINELFEKYRLFGNNLRSQFKISCPKKLIYTP